MQMRLRGRDAVVGLGRILRMMERRAMELRGCWGSSGGGGRSLVGLGGAFLVLVHVHVHVGIHQGPADQIKRTEDEKDDEEEEMTKTKVGWRGAAREQGKK